MSDRYISDVHLGKSPSLSCKKASPVKFILVAVTFKTGQLDFFTTRGASTVLPDGARVAF